MEIKESFNKWFYENPYGLTGTRAEYVTAINLIPMIRAAYEQGALDMAKDTIDTLGDYGTAVAGCPEVLITPTQKYDDVAKSLYAYYKDEIFGENYES